MNALETGGTAKFFQSRPRRSGQSIAMGGNLLSNAMKRGLLLRLGLFGLAMLAVMLAIGWTAQTTWQEARHAHEKFDAVQVESFEIADYFQEKLLDLDGALQRYALLKDPADWLGFIQESEKLDRWIDEESPKLRNPEEMALLKNINDAYDAFRANAHSLTNLSRSASISDTALREVDRIKEESKTLLRLSNKLAQAHRDVMGKFIESTQNSLNLLQQVIFGLLLLLLGLGAWLAVVVYLEMIAPLRVKLIESQTIIERQEKLASLGVLAAGLAHEIRNPLTAIKARLFTQQKVLRPGSRELQDSVVIGNEINRLEHIVKDVLLFARPAEPKFAQVPTGTLFTHVRDLLGPQLEKNAIQLRIEDGPRVTLRVDPAQLQQVLINLVQNAAESIERNGAITLRSRRGVAPLRGVSQPVVILEVEDTGKGIPSKIQKRLFDPFFTTKEAGTGLGLAISARIVEKHGGALEFQTQPNRGTTFGIVLPCSAIE
jgi:signal transduction histidine kinase